MIASQGVLSRGRGYRALAFAIAMALSSSATWAQDPAPDKDDAKAREPTTLATVTVTAERRRENIQKVPVSITTLGSAALHAFGNAGDDVRALSFRVPSLVVESSFGRTFPRFYIRGLGNTDFDLNASQPVSLIYDEVVQENPILKGFPIFDIDQVEVMRGPQGTLFGRNTPAGVVKFQSVMPSRDINGYVTANYGTYGTFNAEGAVGGALGDNVSARGSALFQKRNNWVDNTFPGAPNSKLEGYLEGAARLQFLIKPSDNFSALLNVHGRNLDGTARLFRASVLKPETNDLNDGFERDKVSIDARNEQHLDSFGASANLNWNLGRTTLHSITGYEHASVYSRGDIDGGSVYTFPPRDLGDALFPSESADGLPEHHQYTQEFRLESNEWGRFDWQAGFYYFDEKIVVDSFSYDTFFGGLQNGYAQQRQQDKSWALFGSFDYDVTDAFKLRGGLRYTHDEKDFRAERFVSPFFLPDTGPLLANPSASKVNWDLSGTWAVQDDVNLYARVATGFRAPSIQGRVLFAGPTPSLSVADEESVLSFEAGVKADFWDHRARLSFDVFHYTIDNQQLNAVGGTSNTTILLNADKSVGQGFEFDGQAYLTENLLVTLGLSYNDTEIKDKNLAVAPCGGLCTVLDPRINNDHGTPLDPTDDFLVALIDGNPLPQSPKWIANFTAQYSHPFGDGEFFVYTDWAYRSKINYFLYESVEFTGKPLLEGGLRVGYNWDYGHNEIALYGRNITNRMQVIYGIDFNNLTGVVNEPRIWGIEFSKKF